MIRAEETRARGRRSESVSVLRGKELKLEEVKVSHTRWTGEGGVKGQGIGEARELTFSLDSVVQSKVELN